MELEKIEMFREAMNVGEIIWKIVIQLDNFSRNTLGNQIARSSDSIAANISEGEGVYHFGDKKRYLYYARGSLFETKTWLLKLSNRELIPSETYVLLSEKLELVRRLINGTLSKIHSK